MYMRGMLEHRSENTTVWQKRAQQRGHHLGSGLEGYLVKKILDTLNIPMKIRLLSRDSQSSEQFACLNRRYDEMQAEFARVSLTISETSQEEAL